MVIKFLGTENLILKGKTAVRAEKLRRGYPEVGILVANTGHGKIVCGIRNAVCI